MQNALGADVQTAPLQIRAMPKNYSKDLVAVTETMLTEDSDRRPTITEILKNVFMQKNLTEFGKRHEM